MSIKDNPKSIEALGALLVVAGVGFISMLGNDNFIFFLLGAYAVVYGIQLLARCEAIEASLTIMKIFEEDKETKISD